MMTSIIIVKHKKGKGVESIMIEVDYTGILIAVISVTIIILLLHQVVWRQYQKHISDLMVKNEKLNREKEAFRRSGDSLKYKEEFYHVLFSNTEDMVFVHGITPDGLPGVLLEVNDVACEKLGYSRKKLLGMTPMDIEISDVAVTAAGYTASEMVTLSDKELLKRDKMVTERPARKFIEKLLEKGHLRIHKSFLTAEGKEIPVEVHSNRFDMPDRTIIMSTAHDVSGRKKAERALSESERQFRNFFTHSPTGIAIFSTEKELVDVNPACLKMFGVPDKEEFSRFNMFDNQFTPDHIRRKLKASESVRYEAAIDFEKVKESSLFVTYRTGEAYYDIMVGSLGMSDDGYTTLGYLVQVQDISKRRYAEISLTESEKQLRQAEKMEAIGSMAGGIAHDFNNILTPILGYTEITMRSLDKEDKTYNYMQEVLKASHRAKELVNQILTFSRQRDKEGKPIRVTPIVKEVITLISASMPEEVDVSRMIKTEHDIVLADPTQIHQVLMNLCTNAMHAMKNIDSGLLEVMMTDFILEPRSKSKYPTLSPGRHLMISVRDTGTGMDLATTSRIFEPFFTTKKSGEGTGMGLAVVHSIVKSFGGVINVNSEIGKGTTFNVILPSLEDQAEAIAAAIDMPIPSGTECILIVDDEPEIIELEACMLGDIGYKPVIANESLKALQLFKTSPERFDIAILDQVMPGMIGTELAKEMTKIRSDIPVILCTGFSESISPDEAKAMGIHKILMKPIVMRELAVAVREALDSTL